MPQYNHPDVYIEEVKGNPPVTGVPLSVAAFMGICRKGPVNDPEKLAVSSFGEFVRKCGTYDSARSELAYAVKGFFDNGGRLAYINRLAHYTDVTDKTTLVADKASTGATIVSVGGAASAATVTGTQTPTYWLVAGDHIDIDLDNGGKLVATFDAAQAVAAGSGLSLVDLDGDTLILSIDNGPSQTVTFTAAATTAALAAAEINAQLYGAYAVVNAGEIDIYSDTYGTGSEVDITGGTALTELGHSVGVDSGTGDVADISAVTFAEVEAVLEADITGLLVTQDADGYIVLTSPTTGAASEIDIDATSSAALLATLGFSVGVTTGSASATEHCLTVYAHSEGEWGNDLSVEVDHNPLFTSLGAGNDLYADITASDTSMQLKHGEGLKAGVVLAVSDGSTTEYVEVESVSRAVVGSTIVTTVNIVGSFTNGFTAATDTVTSLEFDLLVYEKGTLVETWKQLSMLDTAANYVETVVNDEATGSLWISVTDEDAAIGEGADQPAEATYALSGGDNEATGLVTADIVGDESQRLGLYALDALSDISLLAIPDQTAVDLIQQTIDYAENRQDLFYVFGPPAGYTKDQVKTWRQATGAWETKFAAMYWPRIVVADPSGAGSSPQLTIDPVGHVLGVYARVDNLAPPDGGIWSTPAGIGDFGKVRGALKLETYPNDTDQDVLNPIGVNCLRRFKGQGITVWGGRTLSSDPDWRYISVRRFFTHVEQSILQAVQADVFRNNDLRLWQRLTAKISAFLRGLWRDGAMPGATMQESFYVTIDATTTTPADVAAGRLIGEIGIAPQRPAEFIIFRFSQFDAGTELSE